MTKKRERKKKKKISPEILPAMDAPHLKQNPVFDSINNTNGIYLLFGLLSLIYLFVFKDYIFFRKLYLFLDFGFDSYNLFYPAFVHNVNYIHTEGIPTWSFSKGMGGNVFPGGISSPFNLIFILLGPERLGYGIIFVEILKSLLTGITFYFYLKILDFSKYTRIVGGVLAAFLGYLILGSAGWYGHSSNILYFVLMLYAFELFYQKNNWTIWPIAMFFVAQDPFRLYIFGVFFFTYTLFRIFSDNKFGPKESIIFILKLAGFSLIGAGMCVVFTYDSFMGMINSPRGSGEVKAARVTSSVSVFTITSLLQGVTTIMRSFSTDLMGTASNYKGWFNYLEAPAFYSGLTSLLLAPQIILLKNKRKRIAFIAFFSIWMVPLIFPFFRLALYGFMGDYYKHGLSIFIPFIFLLFGLYGLENIQKKNNLNYVVLLITFLFLLLVLYIPYFEGTRYAFKDIINSDLRSVITSFLFLYTGIFYLFQFDKFRDYFKLFLLLVLCIEVGYLSSITVNNRKVLTSEQYNSKVGYNDYSLDAVNYLKSVDTDFYRINKAFFSSLANYNFSNDAQIQGFYGTSSYSSYNQSEYIDFLEKTGIIDKNQEYQTRWSRGLASRPFLQAIASVKYNIIKKDTLASQNLLFKTTYDPVKTIGDVLVLKNKYFLPFGFSYDKYITLKDFESLPSKKQKDVAMLQSFVTDSPLPDLKRITPDEIIKSVKRFNTGDISKIVDRKKSDAMEMTYFSQKNIKGTIALDKKKLLFFSIPLDSGWMVYDNGEPAEIMKTNIGFMGIMLNKGKHNIELEYQIKHLKFSIPISILSLIIYLTMLILSIPNFRKSR